MRAAPQLQHKPMMKTKGVIIMRYEFNGKSYDLTEAEIERLDEVVEKAHQELSGSVNERVNQMYEKRVDEIAEKAEVKHEGKLFGAALKNVIEKAKKDLRDSIENEIWGVLPKSLTTTGRGF